MLRSVDIFISFCIWNLKQWIFVAIIILLCRLLNNSKFLPILIFIYFCHGTKMNFTLIWKKLKISVIVLHLILFRTLDVFDRFYLATNEYQYKIFYGCFHCISEKLINFISFFYSFFIHEYLLRTIFSHSVKMIPNGIAILLINFLTKTRNYKQVK